jgi:glucose/arabinose dehydrogenase
LYIAISEYFVAGSLVRIDNIDSYALSRTTAPPSAVTLLRDDLPNDSWHGWRYIRADAQKNLYLAIGANCNACNVYGQTVDNGAQYNKAYDANMTNVRRAALLFPRPAPPRPPPIPARPKPRDVSCACA